MKFRSTITAVFVTSLAAMTLVTASGCAVQRHQESVGNYIDDAAITTAVKARFVENHDVDASSIRVETMHGVVMLSGFAKSADEKNTAESLAMKVEGVKKVKNELAIHGGS